VKIVARTQRPLSSQDEPIQMLHGKISHSNLHSVEWQSTEWRSESCSCKLPLINELHEKSQKTAIQVTGEFLYRLNSLVQRQQKVPFCRFWKQPSKFQNIIL